MDKQVDHQVAKAAAGQKAATLVLPGMLLGLGTGTTAFFFIEALGLRCREGLQVTAVASSEASLKHAREVGIPIADIQTIKQIDLTVDGADELDPKKQMIKGGGGALLREKILASASKEMLVVIDAAKQVKHLGAFPLPVEIVPFCVQATLYHLNALGYRGQLRQAKSGGPYQTDNGNLIYDIKLNYPCLDPAKEERAIKAVPGVVETGFFLGIAGRIVIGYPDGHVEILA